MMIFDCIKMPAIYVRDYCTKCIHMVGTNEHDRLYLDDDGHIQYFNLQNGCGTPDEYDFVLDPEGHDQIDGRITQCSVTRCSKCDFNGDCIERKFKWLKQPYKKLPYKLSQFEFDIIQTYRDCHESCKISEFKQLIELKDKGYFKCIDHDTKIQDVLKNCEVIQ